MATKPGFAAGLAIVYASTIHLIWTRPTKLFAKSFKNLLRNKLCPCLWPLPELISQNLSGIEGKFGDLFYHSRHAAQASCTNACGSGIYVRFLGSITRKSHGISDQRFLWDHQTFSGDWLAALASWSSTLPWYCYCFHNPQSTTSYKNPPNSPQLYTSPNCKKNKNIQKLYPKKSVCITLHLIILNLYSHSPKNSPIFRASLWSFSTQISPQTRHGLSMPASGAPFPRPLLARPVWCCPTVGPRRPSSRLARHQGFRHTPKDDDEEENEKEKNWGWGWGSLYFTHISLYRNTYTTKCSENIDLSNR